MITIRNISIDYQKVLMVLSTILVFGILLKIPDKRPYVAIETLLLSFTLIFSIIYLASIKTKDIKLSPLLFFFLLYLFLYNFIIIFIRPLEVDVSLFDSLLFSIQEFRIFSICRNPFIVICKFIKNLNYIKRDIYKKTSKLTIINMIK